MEQRRLGRRRSATRRGGRGRGSGAAPLPMVEVAVAVEPMVVVLVAAVAVLDNAVTLVPEGATSP